MGAMPTYPVMCAGAACPAPALFKIAAQWSDGTTRELKTYALSCPACLKALFDRAGSQRRACRLAPGETLDAPGIYELARGAADHRLHRRVDLEG